MIRAAAGAVLVAAIAAAPTSGGHAIAPFSAHELSSYIDASNVYGLTATPLD
jgi:hypothetical protein